MRRTMGATMRRCVLCAGTSMVVDIAIVLIVRGTNKSRSKFLKFGSCVSLEQIDSYSMTEYLGHALTEQRFRRTLRRPAGGYCFALCFACFVFVLF